MIESTLHNDEWFDALPRSPKERGSVHGLVVRTGHGLRAMPEELELVPGQGVVGDAWKSHPRAQPGNEVSLMNVHVLREVAQGDESRMALSGDNLHVDLDLSEANLPIGTRLQLGTAVVSVSALPHRPCGNFVERFGADAARQVAHANRRGQRARGVLCSVEQSGRVRRGDPIVVLRVAAAST